MIRLVHLLRRRSDFSDADFTAYWRDVHGPLVAGLQTALGIVRHVQLHRDPADQVIERAAEHREVGPAGGDRYPDGDEDRG